MNLTLPVVTSAALIDSINPCAISILLLTIGFLISLEKKRSSVLVIGGAYILGLFITYILIGMGVLSALTFFGIPRTISRVGALILILSGVINLLGHLIPDFPIKLQIPAFSKPGIAKLLQKASLPAAFIMGIFVGLFEFPCTGGPYLLILSLLHEQATFVSGSLYLIYYNLIFVSPLIVILALGSHPKLLTRIQDFRSTKSKNLDFYSSIAMIILGLIIFIL